MGWRQSLQKFAECRAWRLVWLVCVMLPRVATPGEPLPIRWQASFGSRYWEDIKAVHQTRDGGYLVLAEADASGYFPKQIRGNKTDSGFSRDIWLVKLDANGVDQWDRAYGGSGYSYPINFFQCKDGGFLVAGHSAADFKNPNMTARRFGGNDFWVFKIDEGGKPLWDRTFGGEGHEYLSSMHPTADGGCILGGTSHSSVSGNRTTPNRGTSDFWVVKVDSSGNKQWEHSFGATGGEVFNSIIPTSDGGYALGGRLDAYLGGTASFGSADFYLVKLDGNGNPLWARNYGGGGFENLQRVRQTADGGFILGGDSSSDISGNKTTAPFGYGDIWMVRTDPHGSKLWDVTLGGSLKSLPGNSAWDYFGDVHEASDGSFLIIGASGSLPSGNKTSEAFGSGDGWLVRLSAAGMKEWDQSFGGSGGDWGRVIEPTKDGGYLLGLLSESTNSGNKIAPYFGGPDIYTKSPDVWLVKIGGSPTSEVPALTATGSPSRQTIPLSSNAVCDVLVFGLAPITYQWQKDGTNLAGEISRKLSFPAVQLQDAGRYSVVVSDSRGSVTSSPAILQVSTSIRLRPPQPLSNGALRLQLQHGDGRAMTASDISFFEVYASTNLNTANWQRFTNSLLVTNGQLYLDDRLPPGTTRRFYRVRQR